MAQREESHPVLAEPLPYKERFTAMLDKLIQLKKAIDFFGARKPLLKSDLLEIVKNLKAERAHLEAVLPEMDKPCFVHET